MVTFHRNCLTRSTVFNCEKKQNQKKQTNKQTKKKKLFYFFCMKQMFSDFSEILENDLSINTNIIPLVHREFA